MRLTVHYASMKYFLRSSLCLLMLSITLGPRFSLATPPTTSIGQWFIAASAIHKQAKLNPNCTNNGTYTNRKRQTVPRPESCSSQPDGATAQCRDGTYSFSQSHRGPVHATEE